MLKSLQEATAEGRGEDAGTDPLLERSRNPVTIGLLSCF